MERNGGKLLAISVDSPEINRQTRDELGLSFPILSDEGREVVKAYGLVHEGGAPDETTIAVPAHLLVRQDRRIAWRFRASRIQDRPTPDDDIRAIRAIRQG
jgi:peroxiredoxin